MDILGLVPFGAILQRAGELIYDRLEKDHGIRLSIYIGNVVGVGGASPPYIIVNVYNRSPHPQTVENVSLTLSHGAGGLMIAYPLPPWQGPPQVVTDNKNYSFGFDLAKVADSVRKSRERHKNQKIRVVGASVSLASGRSASVRASPKIKELWFKGT